MEESRIIYPSVYYDMDVLNDFTDKQTTNRIKTTKYNIFTFIPLNLFCQFKRFANIYFLFIVCLNFVPEINAFGKYLAPIPILFVLLLTLVKDGVEDLRRWQSDRKVNNTPCLIFNCHTQSYETSCWQDVSPGDLIKITANETIPADILVFQSSEITGNCFIETSNLDGEINLKQREIVKDNYIKESTITPEMFGESFLCVEAPNKEIYKFSGKWVFENGSCPSVSLKKSNLILRGCVLRNTEYVTGIVIYTGHETKSMLNNNKLTFKHSKLEEQINKDVIWCVGILFILCLVCSIGHSLWLQGFNDLSSIVFFSFDKNDNTNSALQGFFVFWTSLIMFQAIIPLPLYVTIELVKLHHVFHITRDLELYDEEKDRRIEVRAYNIAEDMGQIQYIFCDKTGTLTENLMEFQRATINQIDYYDEVKATSMPQDSFPLNKIIKTLKKFYRKDALNDSGGKTESKLDVSGKLIGEFVMLMAVCNTTMVSENKNQSKIVVGIPSSKNRQNQQDSVNRARERRQSQFGNNLAIFGIVEVKCPEPPPQIALEETFIIPKNLKTVDLIDDLDPGLDTKSLLKPSSSSSISKLQRYNSNRGKCPYKDETLFRFYESESPDEIALVKTACKLGLKLLQRGPGFVCVWNEYDHKAFELDVLSILPFDSVRKRMSVIILDPETNIITLYSKGADTSILPLLSKDNNQKLISKTTENLTNYSKFGLRTLMMAYKVISEKDFLQWNDMLRAAEQNFSITEAEMMTIYSLIEKDLTLLGASGIEDKLQESVPECLESFHQAGINIWILTGDKLETAINIAYSARLFATDQEVFIIDGRTEEEVLEKMGDFCYQISKEKIVTQDSHLKKFGLVLEGEIIEMIMRSGQGSGEGQVLFVELAVQCNAVVCCRATPNQKAEIVAMVQKYLGVRTLAIGDGANDVNMIRVAHVGVGIGGQEGMQAVMASDFAITKFRYLRRLLLVHGHRCYDQLARMSLYMFYKDTIIVLVLFWYQILNGFSGSIMIDQISLAFFNFTITGLPPLILGIWDKDFEADILENNPQIYKSGIKHKSYRPRDFWRNILDSIWQSLAIFWITYLCSIDDDTDIGEFGIICTTGLVMSTYAHMLIESKFWSPFHWLACVGSLLVTWFGEVFLLNSLCIVKFDCSSDNPYKIIHNTMIKPKTYLILLLAISTALLPRVTIKSYLITTRPSVLYEAQRRINNDKRTKTNSNLGDLESEKKMFLSTENLKPKSYWPKRISQPTNIIDWLRSLGGNSNPNYINDNPSTRIRWNTKHNRVEPTTSSNQFASTLQT